MESSEAEFGKAAENQQSGTNAMTTNIVRPRNGLPVIEKRTFPNVDPQELSTRSEMSPGAANAAPGRASKSAHDQAVAGGMTGDRSAGALLAPGVSVAAAAVKSQTTSVTDHSAELRQVQMNDDEKNHDDVNDNVVAITQPQSLASSETTTVANLYAHKIIGKARKIVAEAHAASAKETGGKPHRQSTLETYAKYISAYEKRSDQTEGVDDFVARKAANANTFYSIRAALKHDSVLRMQTCLANFDHAADDARYSLLSKINDAMTDYSALSNIKRKDALHDLGIKRRRTRSKKEDLPLFPKSLVQQFLELNRDSGTYRILGAIQCLSGCRPEELTKGVKIKALPNSIEFHFFGAKTGKKKGQEWRRFEIERSFLPSWLFEMLASENGNSFELKSKTAMRSHYRRIGLQLKDDAGIAPNSPLPLSPFIFRHLLVTELREAGWTDAEIAPVIGDQSADTVRHHYGAYVPSKKRGKVKARVIKSSVDAAQINLVRAPTKNGDTFRAFKKGVAKKLKPLG